MRISRDLDWGKKAKAAGRRIAYVASAPVVHVHQESFRTIQNRYRREAIALKRIYPEHELGLGEATVLVAGNVAADAYRALREGKPSEMGGIVKFRVAQFLGSYQGHRHRGEVNAKLKRRFYYPKKFWIQIPADAESGTRVDYAVTV